MDKEAQEQCISVGVLSVMSLIGGIATGAWQNYALVLMGVLIMAMIIYFKRKEILDALKNDAGDNDPGLHDK